MDSDVVGTVVAVEDDSNAMRTALWAGNRKRHCVLIAWAVPPAQQAVAMGSTGMRCGRGTKRTRQALQGAPDRGHSTDIL